jgi:hypothetical protein
LREPADETGPEDAEGPPKFVVARVPLLSGASNDGRTIYFDYACPETIKLASGRTVDVYKAIAHHEAIERHLMVEAKLSYDDAHEAALLAEHLHLMLDQGLDPAEVAEYETALASREAKAAKTKSGDEAPPPDLYLGPYRHQEGFHHAQ